MIQEIIKEYTSGDNNNGYQRELSGRSRWHNADIIVTSLDGSHLCASVCLCRCVYVCACVCLHVCEYLCVRMCVCLVDICVN